MFVPGRVDSPFEWSSPVCLASERYHNIGIHVDPLLPDSAALTVKKFTSPRLDTRLASPSRTQFPSECDQLAA